MAVAEVVVAVARGSCPRGILCLQIGNQNRASRFRYHVCITMPTSMRKVL